MTQSQTPIESIYAVQKSTIEHSQNAIKQGVKLQQAASEAVLRPLDAQKSLQKRGADFSKTTAHAYVSAIESMVPGDAATFDDVHSSIDAQFDAFDELHDDAWSAVERTLEENIDTLSALTEQQFNVLNEWISASLEAVEQVESQATAVAETFEESAE